MSYEVKQLRAPVGVKQLRPLLTATALVSNTRKARRDSRRKGMDNGNKTSHFVKCDESKSYFIKHPSKWSLPSSLRMSSCIEHFLALAREVHKKRASVLKDKDTYDEKYFSSLSKTTDVKVMSSFDEKLSLYDTELQAIRSAARDFLSTSRYNDYKTRLSVTQVFPSTVTSGVCNSVQPLNASGITDFSAFASLFDVYRIRGGEYRFQYGMLGASTSSTPANTGCELFVLAYDVNSTAASNAGTLADDAQAQTYLLPGAVNFGGTQIPTGQLDKLHTFRWRTTPGVVDSASTSPPIQGSGDWCLSSDTTSAYGYLKPYGIFGTATAVANAVNGILTGDFEFRMRV